MDKKNRQVIKASENFDAETQEPKPFSLPEEIKAAIRQEEIFRDTIRSQIAEDKIPRTLFGRGKQFVNSAFGIWVLSTIVVGLFTWCYTEITAAREKNQRKKQRIEMLDTEIAGRLRYIDGLMKADVSPFLYVGFMFNGTTLGSSGAGAGNTGSNPIGKTETPGIFPDFKDRPITSLIWELKELVPEKEKAQLDTALIQAEDLNFINVKLFGEIFQKTQNEEDIFGIITGKKAADSAVAQDITETVMFLLKNGRWQTANRVSATARAQIEKLRTERDAKREKLAAERLAAYDASEKERKQKDEAAHQRRLKFLSITPLAYEQQESNTILVVAVTNISGHDIKAFRGEFSLADPFGKKLFDREIQHENVLKNQETVKRRIVLTERGFFGSELQLTNRTPAALQSEFAISDVIYADGTRLKLVDFDSE